MFFTDEGPEHHSGENQKIFIIGGLQIYNQYCHQCDVIWVTRIHDDYQCDTFLNIDKILHNYWLSQVVLQGEGFVIEKYIRYNVFSVTSGTKSSLASQYERKATSPSLVTPFFIPEPFEKLRFSEVKRTEPPRHPIGVSGWEPSAPIRSGSKRFLDSLSGTKSGVKDGGGGAFLSYCEARENDVGRSQESFWNSSGNPTTNGLYKLFHCVPLSTNIFTRTTKRVHHKNNEDT